MTDQGQCVADGCGNAAAERQNFHTLDGFAFAIYLCRAHAALLASIIGSGRVSYTPAPEPVEVSK